MSSDHTAAGQPRPPVVLVTGATGGIGRAVALAYARRGARLVLFARSAGLLTDLADACRNRDAQAVTIVGDVGDVGDVQRAVAMATEHFGALDIVVHTAAVVAYGRLTDVPQPVWDKVIATGIGGTANVARAALTAFEAGDGGHLVVIGSVLGQITAPLMGSYVTSKWAVRGLTRVLQQEARQTPGVYVSLVSPGGVNTRIYSLAATYVGRSGSPPPPVISPEWVASTVLRVVDRNQANAAAGPVNWVMRLGFSLVPRIYDALVTPLFERLALGRQPQEASEGNVFAPSEAVGPARGAGGSPA